MGVLDHVDISYARHRALEKLFMRAKERSEELDVAKDGLQAAVTQALCDGWTDADIQKAAELGEKAGFKLSLGFTSDAEDNPVTKAANRVVLLESAISRDKETVERLELSKLVS